MDNDYAIIDNAIARIRVLARASWMREHGFSPGMRIGREWIFHRSELDNLRGGPVGRPRKEG